MLNNYLKIAIKVLGRNKFFTFVSLFGISITLMILIVLSAFYDSSFGPYGPEKKLDRILFVSNAKFSNPQLDRSSQGSVSYYFLNKTVRSLKTPELVSFPSMYLLADCYTATGKIPLYKKFTDEEYWKILDFNFIQGRPINRADIENANKVAVLSSKACIEYFGDINCLGKIINIENEEFIVIGIVEDVTLAKMFSFSHIYLPYTTSGIDFSKPVLLGDFVAMILAKDKDDCDQIASEYQKNLSSFQFPSNDFNTVESHACTFLESVFKEAEEDGNAHFLIAKMISVILLLLFMAFPTINLVNMNITRIIERSSEIGVRKSFGASIRTLMWQFIVENVIVTLLGGFIGFILAIIVIVIINTSGIIPYVILSINFMLFIYALGITVFFGVFSGVLPAWKMSKLKIMYVLKIDKQ